MTIPEQPVIKLPPLRGLLVREPWASLILSGEKTWEIRGSRTAQRGEIYVIRSGSGRIAGSCHIIDVLGPLSIDDMLENTKAHLTPADELRLCGLPYKNTFAWVLSHPHRFTHPVPYKHPSGAITWVALDELREELPCRPVSEWQSMEHSARS